MRLCAAAAATGAVALLASGTAVARVPPPPSFAFQDATLNRAARSVDVRIQAVDELGVVVRVNRRGRMLGRQEAQVHTGHTMVRVHIGPRSLRKLRPGLRVVVAIYFGGPPLRITTRLLEPADPEA
jgi:hypothetical protein